MVIAVATLATPSTLRFSRTYFNTPGRNIVFLCALLKLAGPCLPLVMDSTSYFHAGLVSLSVAFFRAKTRTCIGENYQTIHDGSGDPGLCWLHCAAFPDTPIRGGSNSWMQLGFAPRTGVTLNIGIILSIAFSLLAFSSILTMWNHVIVDNARKLGFIRDATSILPRRKGEGRVEGLLGWMSHPPDKFSSQIIRLGLHLMELLVYSSVMLATIIISEVTFWSVEMRAGAEPMTFVCEFLQRFS